MEFCYVLVSRIDREGNVAGCGGEGCRQETYKKAGYYYVAEEMTDRQTENPAPSSRGFLLSEEIRGRGRKVLRQIPPGKRRHQFLIPAI